MAVDVIDFRTVVLFALGREAKPFRRDCRNWPYAHVAVTGIGPVAGRVAAEMIDRHRPHRVIMAGFGGALRPDLRVGDVVRPAEVVDEAGAAWPCALDGTGRLVTVARIAATAAEKHALRDRFGADAVDMESAAVAAVCAAWNVPFVAVRSISDTADTELSPPLARLFASGRVSWWRALGALVRTPSLLGEFSRLARDTRHAAETLAAALGPVAVCP